MHYAYNNTDGVVQVFYESYHIASTQRQHWYLYVHGLSQGCIVERWRTTVSVKLRAHQQHCNSVEATLSNARQSRTILSTKSNVASTLLQFLATTLPVSATMFNVSGLATMSNEILPGVLKSTQTEHVQFVSMLSKGRNFCSTLLPKTATMSNVEATFDSVERTKFYDKLVQQQSRMLLRHCCWCARGFTTHLFARCWCFWRHHIAYYRYCVSTLCKFYCYCYCHR